MPSHLHEVLIEMFRDRPEFAAEVLAGPLGVPIPAYGRAEVSSSELTDVMATEYRADAVITLSGADSLVLAVIIEVQLRVDARKRRTWPAYVTTLHARLGSDHHRRRRGQAPPSSDRALSPRARRPTRPTAGSRCAARGA